MKNFTLLFLLFISVQSVFSQADKKNGTSYTEIIEAPVPDPVINEIVKNITIARDNNDAVSKLYWEGKLNEITKPQIIKESPGEFNFKGGEENQSSSQIINLTTIAGGKIIANAISRDRVHGHIYAAVGVYGTNILPDTLKVFRSYDNGITFSLLYKFTNSSLAIHNNSLDIEAVSNGDSSYAFVTLSYTSTGNSNSAIFRVRQDGLMQSGVLLAGTANRKYTNIRMTSDNARYTSNAYIYISATLDTTSGGTRLLKSRLFRAVAPFAPVLQLISSYQHPVNGHYGYGLVGGVNDTGKFETDIAFVNSEVDVPLLCTVTIVSGVPGLFNDGKSLYFTKDATFGANAPLLFSAGESGQYPKESPRFAATGYSDNSAVVAVRGLYDGGDWDPYFFYTSDITAAAPDFIFSYVDNSYDTTMSVSVAANYRSKGSYLFAYNNRFGQNGGNIFVRAFNDGKFFANVQVNPINNQATNSLGAPDAGFRNVNNDSCLVIWGGSLGMGSYVSGGCSGPVIGIHSSNTIADGYRLSQNYPNPFNPVTTISYELPIKGLVTLKIYDVLGAEIMQLVNEVKPAGYYAVDFNAASLSSGTYFYKLTSDKFSDVKKMVVIK